MMNALLGRVLALAGPAVLLASLVPVAVQSGVHAAPAPVTWRHQIGPIVFRSCAACHHPGGSGPFALTTYADARRWGTLMQTVTASRYMPPWLPQPGHGTFAGDRRLSTEDIALIRAWVQAGMPEGEGVPPTPPTYAADWQLGPPDLILEMPAVMQVPASGTDLFQNFVLPVSITATRWVRAMEIKPGSPQVTHHANVIIDRTASIRRQHPADWQSGVPGMDILVDSGDRFDPDSHFLFWKPDSTALVEPEGMPWRLDPGNDLVLNMHLKPTGKPEQIRARIGLYFTDKPATAHPMLLQLESDAALDIPAGAAAFLVEDHLRLPVAVDILGIYPHAHYLGKRMDAWATLPTGERRDLILITDWDIDRQSVYRLAQPLALPAGTTIHMQYLYDNSAANPRNPNSPPIRVRAGNRSADEMAHFWLQVLPHTQPGTPDPRIALEKSWMENRLARNPGDDLAQYNLATIAFEAGDSARAITLYRELLARRPDDATAPRTLTSLGSALSAAGDIPAAKASYRAAIAKDPGNADAIFDLATLDLRQNDLEHDDAREAERLFRQLTAADPHDTASLAGLASALLAQSNMPEAKTGFEAVLALDPTNPEALRQLGAIALAANDPATAESLLRRAIAAKDDPESHHLLALTYATTGLLPRAVDELGAWQRLDPQSADPHRALAQVYGQLGRIPDAIREQKAVTALLPQSAPDWNDLGVLEARNGDKPAAQRDLQHALSLDPANPAAQHNLSKL